MSHLTQDNRSTGPAPDHAHQPTPDVARAASTGPTYWRSLDELADTPEFRQYLDSEFPGYDPQTILSGTRRGFLKIMGASFALAGLAGCRRWPKRQLAPYTARPEDQTPGVPEHYATAFDRDGAARPLLVTAFDGRPIKVEGNPEHPASHGAADLISQASVLNLYDPHRLRHPRKAEQRATWSDVQQALGDIAAAADANDGEGLVILVEPTGSPTLFGLLARDLKNSRWSKARVIPQTTRRDANVTDGTKLAFGRALRPIYHLEWARTIVSLDADFMMDDPDAIRLAGEYARSRRDVDDAESISRLYVAEPTFTVTGTNADERLAIRRCDVGQLVAEIAAALDVPGVTAEQRPYREHARTVAADLKQAGENGVVIVGPDQPPEVHAIAHAINQRLGAVGSTVSFVEALPHEPMGALPADARHVLILGGNPVFTDGLDLSNARTTIHLTDAINETSAQCTWALPRTHYLEAWGDAACADGATSIVQPVIEPLFDARSDIEVVGMLLGQRRSGYELVRRTHLDERGLNEKQWRKVLHDGLAPGTAKPWATPTLRSDIPPVDADRPADGEFEIAFRRCYKVLDGRYANNGWLQELPDPITKLAWDNAAYVSPSDAKKLDVKLGDVVRVNVNGTTVDVPVYTLPGQAHGTVTLTLGYGRTVCGPVGRSVGTDVQPLWRAGGCRPFAAGRVSKTGQTYDLVTTQDHYAIDPVGAKARADRVEHELIRSATFEHYKAHPDFVHAHSHAIPLPIYGRPDEGHGHEEHDGHQVDHAHGDHHAAPAHPDGFATSRGVQQFENPLDRDGSDQYQWGMAIDLHSCIGCNACVIACQAENNIPIVGKSQVKMNREMHWIRVDRYFTGDPHDPDSVNAVHQPLMCVHCENAPCEQVCPVSATVHDTEGLNVMVYNRCIGTRYCSNNCPYKVRRFNYADWHARDPRNDGDTPPFIGMPDQEQLEGIGEVERLAFNPEVTVRMRGVMEKCTYCVQRIQQAKQQAKADYGQGRRDDYTVGGDEVRTACQQTCPTQAIHFGNLLDPESKVAKLHYDNQRGYTLLDDLNVRPRTKYLAKITNPRHTKPAAEGAHEHG